MVPPVEGYKEPYAHSARDVAVRSVILHCVSAAGFGVDAEPIMDWLKTEKIWKHVSAKEKAFLCSEDLAEQASVAAQWRKEAQWALLWIIGKIPALGLPVSQCDTGRLVDEIMPGLGEPIDSFLAASVLRHPSEILAEDDRIYNLHCYVRQALRRGERLPSDLVYDVLYQRHYAFDWFRGVSDWDAIPVDT